MDRKNTIGIVGDIAAPVELIVNAADWKRKVYETKLTRQRPDGKEDTYILRFDGYAAGSEETVNKITEGTNVLIGGEIRTENVRDPQPEENRVKVFIYAEVIAINDPPAKEQNEVRICGKICTPPRFRATYKRTADGKKLSVASITVAVNTPSSTSYIPCVCFGWLALRANLLRVGDYVEIYGHFRSRDYKKRIEGQKLPHMRTTYEVSVAKLKTDREKKENSRKRKENGVNEDTK